MVLLYAPGFTSESVVSGPTWTNLQHTWLAGDGSEWDLSHGLSGLTLLAGTRGMLDPPALVYNAKSAAVNGSRHRGSGWDERDCMWRLKIQTGGGSEAWLAHHERFWQTMDPELPGRWVVTQPSGEHRSLSVRYTGLGDDALDSDLGLIDRQQYDLLLTANNPFWLGSPITRTFSNLGGENFYGGAGGGGFGPPYFLSPGVTTATATITNPGHVDVWPTWRVSGPSTTATVGGVTFPMDLDADEWVEINTDPTDQVAYDQDGDDRTAELVDFHLFSEIPKGATVPLEIAMTGNGSVSVSITPAYRRAA